MKNTNKFILNHCSHNKGDNSVLAYLLSKLSLRGEKFTVSTSSGLVPTWVDGDLKKDIKSVHWGAGEWFPYNREALLSKKFLRLKQEIYSLIFNVILFLFAKDLKGLCKLIFKVVYNGEFIKEMQKSDLVISTGGHHISSVLDKDGINPQLLDMICAIAFDKKLVLWAQSIGPVKTEKQFVLVAIKNLINQTHKTFYRCDMSKEFLSVNNCLDKTSELDDSVFGLVQLNQIVHKNDGSEKRAIISIYNSSSRAQGDEDKYINKILSISTCLISHGYHVHFLPMQYKGEPGDERPLIHNMLKLIDSDKASLIDMDKSPLETLKFVSGFDLIVGHKTHSVVYGLALGIPTFAIAYHPKTRYFMRRFSVEQYCLDEKEFLSGNDEIAVLTRVIENSADIATNNKNVSKSIGAKVNAAFDDVIV